MFPEHKTTVDLVIPVFEEAGVIEQIYRQIRAVVDALPYDFHVLLVDDGSRDGTPDSLRAIADEDPRVNCPLLQPQLWSPGGTDCGTG